MKYGLLPSFYFFLGLTVDLQMFPGVGGVRRITVERETLLIFSCIIPTVTILYVCLGSFLSSAIAYLVAAGPSVQLACTALCPNMDLSPNTRTLSASRLPPTHFLTFFFFTSRSDPPQFSARLPVSSYQGSEAHGVQSTMHSTTVGIATLSDRTMAEPSVFIPAEQIELESVPGPSNTVLAVPIKTKSKDMPDYQMSWLRPG